MFAEAYGWSKSEVLEQVYFDEVEDFTKLIQKKKLENYLVFLQIARNPHIQSPETFEKSLRGQYDRLSDQMSIDEPLDKVGLKALKQKLANESHSKIVTK